MSAAAVRDGAPELAYSFGSRSTINTGINEYQPATSCSRYQLTEIRDSWIRVDSTTFQESVGAGTPVGPSYACTSTGGTNITDWAFVSKQTIFYSACGTNPPGRVDGTYRATRTTTREDGYVVGSQTATKTATCATFDSDGGYSYCNGGTPPGCPNTPQSGWVATWRAELGW